MYLLSATEKKTNWPQIIDTVVVWFQNLAFFLRASSPIIYPTHIRINPILIENIKY